MSKYRNSAGDGNDFAQIVEVDQIRYKRKGYGIIVAILTALSYFIVLPSIGKQFYIEYLANQSPIVLYFVISNLLHITTQFIGNSIYAIIYYIEHPFFEKYKILEEPWPWKVDPDKFNQLFKQTLFTALSNAFFYLPSLHLAEFSMNGLTKDISIEGFPSISEIFTQIIFFMIVEDTGFYWMHRLMHTSFFYRNIHKKHHEYTFTIGPASEYAHPIEAIFCNMLPFSLGPIFMGNKCHIVTYWMWVVLRTAETIDGHCGYEFSWSPFGLLPLSGSSPYHNYHHSHNIGNYGSFFTYWDTICGTNRHFNRHVKRMNMQKSKIEGDHVKKG